MLKKIGASLILAAMLLSFSACNAQEKVDDIVSDIIEDMSDVSVPDVSDTNDGNIETIYGALKFEENRGNLFKHGLLLVQEGEQFGYIDVEDKYIIPKDSYTVSPKEISIFQGVNRAVVYKDKTAQIVDEKGNPIGEKMLNIGVHISKNGLVSFADENGKIGYLNTQNGKVVIKPQFDKAEEFADCGLAGVKVGDKWGFINEKGNFVIEPQFYDVYPHNESGIAFGYNKLGEKEYSYSMINAKGEIVLEGAEEFRYIKEMKYGLYLPKKNGLYGCVDINGNLLLDYKYQHIFISHNGEFDEWFANVKNDAGNYGMVDSKGNTIIPFDKGYEYVATEFSCGLAYAQRREHGSWRTDYYNKNGELVFTFKGGSDNFAENGLAPFFASNGNKGYINTSGTIVSDGYDSVYEYKVPSHAAVFTGSMDLNIVDMLGNMLFPQSITVENWGMHGYSNGNFAVGINGAYTVYNSAGTVVLDGMDAAPTQFSDDGYAIISINGKKGVIDKDYNIVIPCKYDNIITDYEDFI